MSELWNWWLRTSFNLRAERGVCSFEVVDGRYLDANEFRVGGCMRRARAAPVRRERKPAIVFRSGSTLPRR